MQCLKSQKKIFHVFLASFACLKLHLCGLVTFLTRAVNCKRSKLNTLPVQVFRWQKNAHISFNGPGFQGIHKNLKTKQKISTLAKTFFRKSLFCTFSCINPRFGRLWDILWIFFSNCHFHIASKECFFRQKSFFGKSEKIPKWHF